MSSIVGNSFIGVYNFVQLNLNPLETCNQVTKEMLPHEENWTHTNISLLYDSLNRKVCISSLAHKDCLLKLSPNAIGTVPPNFDQLHIL